MNTSALPIPAFPAAAFSAPLFLGDADAVAAKLNGADGLLRQYWAEFQQHCDADPKFRAENIFLPAALGGTALAEAKDLLRSYWRSLAENDTAGDYQFHTWCRCGSVLRRAVYVDWLAARGAWTPEELAEAAESFLGYGFKHAFPVLSGRGRSSNNQALSMALYLAVTGFLFGHKLTRHPTGRFLFDYGWGRLPDLIGLFPGDGYGGEGSTYTSHVNTPLAYWTAEFLAQVTGESWLDRPFRPNGTTLRRMLEIELHLVSPGGLLAPWDHYGWQHAINASPFAYLAKANADPRYLALIPALGMWPNPGYLAWGSDDQLWTLVWWPDAFRSAADSALPADLFGWFLPKTGAALDDCTRRARLMQVWDLASGSIAGVGRAQVNPNHIMFDLAGEPVFQDGVPDVDADPWEYPADKVLAVLDAQQRDRFLLYLGSIGGTAKADLKPVVKGLAPGLIGAANAIVVDDEPWFWPGGVRVGTPEFYARTPEFQAVAADCADFYRPHYDVRRARRSSLWTASGVGLVVDDLVADSAHSWTWQVYVRSDTVIDGDGARIQLTNGHHVRLAWEAGIEAKLVPVNGYPRSLDGVPGGSQRLELRRRAQSARFAVAIVPDATTVYLHCRGATRVSVSVDGKIHEFVAANFAARSVSIGNRDTTAVFAWFSPGGLLTGLKRETLRSTRPDVLDISDIAEDRDLQFAKLERLSRWTAERCAPGATRLSQIDAVLAELKTKRADPDVLHAALTSPHWPVQLAAVDAIGRRGLTVFATELRELLAAEQAIPKDELYPPETATGASKEDLAKRWRLKAGLITALGRLGDVAAVPLLGQILRDNRDFYIVYSNAAQALGRIGGEAALAALAPAFAESEVNTRMRAEFAREAIAARA